MALILGKEYCKVDPNGRFKFPIALKKQLEDGEYRFVVRESIVADCLELWPYASFKDEVAFLQSKLRTYLPGERNLLRKLTEGNIVELDSSDRLLVPPEQKHLLKGAKEIVLQSTGKFIEIWDRKTYDEVNTSSSDYAEMAASLLYQSTEQQL